MSFENDVNNFVRQDSGSYSEYLNLRGRADDVIRAIAEITLDTFDLDENVSSLLSNKPELREAVQERLREIFKGYLD